MRTAVELTERFSTTKAAPPEMAPQVRVEWVVAGSRVVLAAGLLLAVAIDPVEHVRSGLVVYLAVCFLAYSLGMLALVWAPLKFARGWGIGVHLFDFGVYTVLTVLTHSATSPFFMCFVFLMICGTLRWQVRGAIWTAVATATLHLGLAVQAAIAPGPSVFELNTLVIRSVSLGVLTFLLAYLSAHQHRFQNEISRLAAWPRRMSRESQAVVAEVVSRSAALLGAPRVVLVWRERGEGGLNLAWSTDGEVTWVEEADSNYEPLVVPALADKTFEVTDAAEERGQVVTCTQHGFRRRRGPAVHEALRARFSMRAVQSWPLRGELIDGRLFALDKARTEIDELVFGELVANVAASHLESMHLLGRLREAAALEERVRVARDLHDSLLQSQAGAALQLLAARRLLSRDPVAGHERLNEIQDQLERGELEMRAFIRDLRPDKPASRAATFDLPGRLEELRRRIERQWEVAVHLRMPGGLGGIPKSLVEDIYRLSQEALVNAARHASASTIILSLELKDEELHLDVIDDGRGFPFHGTYDLARLNEMDEGPWSLKQRVTALAGTLTLDSMRTGSTVRMKVPVGRTD